MKRIIALVSLSILGGCVQQMNGDFDRADNMVKPIAEGLYFIREVTSGGIWREEGKSTSNWEEKAHFLCGNGAYKSMIFQNGDVHYRGIGVGFVGGIPIAGPNEYDLPVAEGVVLCESSSLTEVEALRILEDEYYVMPSQS